MITHGKYDVAHCGDLCVITTLTIPEFRLRDLLAPYEPDPRNFAAKIDYILEHEALRYIAFTLKLLDTPVGKEYLKEALYLVGLDGPMRPTGRTVWKDPGTYVTIIRDVKLCLNHV